MTGDSDLSWERFSMDSDPRTSSYPNEESFELTEDGQLHKNQLPTSLGYKDGNTIDWWYELNNERTRKRQLYSLTGFRGKVSVSFLRASQTWLVVILTGIGIGATGAWLDVLVRWLGDLREGRCSYGFFYNQAACCSGLDPGEICTEWLSWSRWLNVQSILGSVLVQTTIYVMLAVAFAGSAAVLVKSYAPYAFHTGIPEIKAILSGYVFDAFLSPWTLLIKALGLALAVASGLSLGKEGPLVHVACCMAFTLLNRFKQFRKDESLKRQVLAAAAAAGVSVAFGSPLGGVLFSLEELETFANEGDVMWRGFVTSVIAAMTLQWINPLRTSKLVLFQVTSVSDTWRSFELIPWLILGILGGILGSALIRLNINIAIFRRRSVLNNWPILEVVIASGVTAAISYLIVFTRVQSSELVSYLFQECDPTKMDYHGLCNPTATLENIFLLLITAFVKLGLTAWAFGMAIPAGIFLPSIAIGASLGRAVGLLMQWLHRALPSAWFFSSCPPDPTVPCISPGFYAVIGSAAMLGGVTRMTISLVVILFELTGALSHVLPIMISVMTAKWVGDALNKEGIYPAWIALRHYPWLPPVDYHDLGETAQSIMRPISQLVVIKDNGSLTIYELKLLLDENHFHGFPVVSDDQLLIGYVTADKLSAGIAKRAPASMDGSQRCVFRRVRPEDGVDCLNFSDLLEETSMQLRPDVPQELVVRVFQRMNLRHLFFSRQGRLVGLVTKSDIVALLNRHFPHTAALAQDHSQQ